jgi:hypothetical protein
VVGISQYFTPGDPSQAPIHPEGTREVREVAFALPFSFDHDDYVQILTDTAGKLGPALGWQPTTP